MPERTAPARPLLPAIVWALAIFAAAIPLLSGCGPAMGRRSRLVANQAAAPGTKPVTEYRQPADPAAEPDPTRFAWELEAIEAEGEARETAPASAPGSDAGLTEMQRQLAARTAARTAALKKAREQVLGLSIDSKVKIGNVNSTYVSVRRELELQVQQAQTISEEGPEVTGRPGLWRARVRLPLMPTADMLRRAGVSPIQLPNPPATEADALPSVI